MTMPLLHIFRNTPFGRETLFQSAYFCRRMQLPLSIHIPEFKKFLFYFDQDTVQIDLDDSYLFDPESAKDHIQEILILHQVKHYLVKPTGMTASTLPDLPTHFSFMTCPRSMSDHVHKISLGMIGPKVRNIVKSAKFPIYLPSPVFKPWTNLAVLYGGSDNAAGALRLALEVNRTSNAPLKVFSQGDRSEFESQLLLQGFSKEKIESFDWEFWTEGDITDHLYAIPHDSMVILGAYGKGIVRDTLFGSTMEKIQSNLPNNMLVVGPKCKWINR